MRRRSGRLGERRVPAEILAGKAQLLGRGFGLVGDAAKSRVLFAILRVPAEVFARDAHALALAVEGVEIFQVLQQDGANFLRRRRGQSLDTEALIAAIVSYSASPL